MKNKVIISIVTIILLSSLVLCLTSCTKDSENNVQTTNSEIMSIYNSYVAYAEESGESPLSYEAWLESIKGTNGKSAYELYKETYSYKGTELEWLNDLLNGDLTTEEFTITFDSNGGTSVKSQKVKKNDNIVKPDDPTKEGYNFDGWYVDDEKWNFLGYVVTKDLTLTAKWSLPKEDVIEQMVKEEYIKAINDYLDDSQLIEDITNSASTKVAANLSDGIGKVANEQCAASVSRIFLYKNSTDESYSSLATAFLITDSTTSSTERYLVTNAHCARYLKPIYTTYNRGFMGGSYQQLTGYEWASYGKILGFFENDDNAYEMEIVAYGSYDAGSDYSYYYGVTKENNQADLAILKVTGTQPDNTAHPSLKVASNSNQAVRGTDIAIIGNPEGVGGTNSISIGTISQTGITIESWGSGTFLMTDAAINGGNSGGPMVDINGVVVGVVESKLVSTDIDNMGFALDSKTLNDFIDWACTTYSLTINYTQV